MDSELRAMLEAARLANENKPSAHNRRLVEKLERCWRFRESLRGGGNKPTALRDQLSR